MQLIFDNYNQVKVEQSSEQTRSQKLLLLTYQMKTNIQGNSLRFIFDLLSSHQQTSTARSLFES